ncbi:Protein MraZ [Gossypium arboreum]|uniref:Protein MraZ n=1 Tax=Gossypium arboreum TaxID=29729 RepID=A0A0B0P0G7_GOSAR|nr:Protein MraZ [Gossypium arboreum]
MKKNGQPWMSMIFGQAYMAHLGAIKKIKIQVKSRKYMVKTKKGIISHFCIQDILDEESTNESYDKTVLCT